MVLEDWAAELARELAERYVQRHEVEEQAKEILQVIARRCPFRRGVMYVEVEPSLRNQNGCS